MNNKTNRQFDLIFWSDIPILSPRIQELLLKQQQNEEEGLRFLVVYNYAQEDLRRRNVFQEVFYADFCLCRGDDNHKDNNNNNLTTLPPCPDSSSSLLFGHSIDVNKTYEYQRINNGKPFDIFLSSTDRKIKAHNPKGKVPPTLFVRPTFLRAVTLWSETYPQYVLIPFPGVTLLPSKQQQLLLLLQSTQQTSYTNHSIEEEIFPLKVCHPATPTMESTCPQQCQKGSYDPSNGGEEIDHHRYPYLFDSFDRLCKSTHPDAMGRKRPFGGLCSCETTCFTPSAASFITTTGGGGSSSTGTSTVTMRTNPWPWKNENERQKYAPYWNDPDQHRDKILVPYKTELAKRMRFPEYWTYKPRFPCDFNNSSGNSRNKIVDGITRQQSPPPLIGGDFSFHLMFFPDAKLILCGIPKVGITEWAKFLRYTIGAKDYMSIPHFKLDRYGFLLGHLEPTLAREMLDDPTWTKAVFFRNPLERLVSAYEDKIARNGYTQRIFKIGSLDQRKEDRYVLSFSEFVDKIAVPKDSSNCSIPTGLSVCTDPHWKPQLMTCGLDYLLPKFDFVGNLCRKEIMLAQRSLETMANWFLPRKTVHKF